MSGAGRPRARAADRRRPRRRGAGHSSSRARGSSRALTREWLVRRRRDRRRAGSPASAPTTAASGSTRAGATSCPGFIDAHMHVESSKLTPGEFARAVLPHGTTAIVCDPHEVANVLGSDGVHWMLDASEGLPLTVFVMAPSCVPASAFESPRRELTVGDMEAILRRRRALGVAEMMNFPGVIAGDPDGAREARGPRRLARRRPRAGRARPRARRLRRGRDPLRPRGDDRTRRRSRSAGAGCGC